MTSTTCISHESKFFFYLVVWSGARRRALRFLTAMTMVVVAMVLAPPTLVQASGWSAVTVTGLAANEQIVDIDVSGDGQVVAVVGQYDYVYVSTNGGSTWSKPASVNPSTRDWVGVDVSHDGTKIVAAYNGYLSPSADDGGVWMSTNSGSTWTDVSPDDAMSTFYRLADVAMSDDGSKIIACGEVYNSSNSGYVWVSTDSGSTWGTGGSARKYFKGCTMDSDGSVMYAAGNGQMGASGGGVFKSTDNGATWTTHLPTGTTTDNSMWFVSTNSTGSVVMASVYGSSTKLYVSTNSGSTWTASSSSFSNVRRTFVSRDGSNFVANVTGGIAVSTDGVSYATTNIFGSNVFSSFAASADMSKVWATHYASGVFSNTSFSSDVTPPTATWTAPSSPSGSRTLSYTVTFSEPVTGIAAGDFSNTGTATGCVFTPSGTSGTSVSVSVTCSSDGTVVARLAANSVSDLSSNTGPASAVSASTVTVDTSLPTTTSTTLPSNSIAPVSTSPGNSTAPSNTSVSTSTSTTVSVNRSSSSLSTSTSTSTSTSSTTTTTTTTTLAPLSVPDIADAVGALVIDGEEVQPLVARENNQLIISSDSFRAQISAVKRDGSRAPLDSDGKLRLVPGDSIEVEVEGFASDSLVEVRMYSEPILLGRSGVNSAGNLSASYEIPSEVEDGRHTVVLFGESTTRQELTFALEVFVGSESTGPSELTILAILFLVMAAVSALVIPALLRRQSNEIEVRNS